MIRRLLSTRSQYGILAVGYHWVSAVVFIGIMASGYIMTGYLHGKHIWSWYAYHKQAGLVMLLIAVGRIINRVIGKTVLSPQALLHQAMYAGLFVMPISGWVMSSSAGYPPKLFGVVLPIVSDGNQLLTDAAWYSHFVMGLLMFIWIVIHIAGLIISYQQGKKRIFRMSF